jgi:hypothetical protein
VVLPHRGVTFRRMGCGHREQPAGGKVGVRPALRLNHTPPFTPFTRAATMRSVQTACSVGSISNQTSPACVALAGTNAGGCSGCPSITHPPSCGPFAPRPLRRFLATMAALTPAGGRVTRPVNGLPQVSLLHVHDLPDHSVSNHHTDPRRRFDTLPLSAAGLPPSGGVWTSPLPSRLVGSV